MNYNRTTTWQYQQHHILLTVYLLYCLKQRPPLKWVFPNCLEIFVKRLSKRRNEYHWVKIKKHRTRVLLLLWQNRIIFTAQSNWVDLLNLKVNNWISNKYCSNVNINWNWFKISQHCLLYQLRMFTIQVAAKL